MYLETKRTIIREFNINDTNDLYEILSNEETMKYIEPVNTYEQTKEFLETFCIKDKKAFAVVNKEDNKMFGYLLFKSVDDPLVYEIGWINNKKYWNKGLAYESCKCVIDYAFTEMKIHKIFASTIDNSKSGGLMRKLGFVLEGVQRSQVRDNDDVFSDYYLYGLLESDLKYKNRN